MPGCKVVIQDQGSVFVCASPLVDFVPRALLLWLVWLQNVSLSLHHGGWYWEGHLPLTVLCGDMWRV